MYHSKPQGKSTKQNVELSAIPRVDIVDASNADSPNDAPAQNHSTSQGDISSSSSDEGDTDDENASK